MFVPVCYHGDNNEAGPHLIENLKQLLSTIAWIMPPWWTVTAHRSKWFKWMPAMNFQDQEQCVLSRPSLVWPSCSYLSMHCTKSGVWEHRLAPAIWLNYCFGLLKIESCQSWAVAPPTQSVLYGRKEAMKCKVGLKKLLKAVMLPSVPKCRRHVQQPVTA